MDKQNKLVIVVSRGMVETVYVSSTLKDTEWEVLDMDTTIPDEIRRTEAAEKQASDTLVKIYG